MYLFDWLREYLLTRWIGTQADLDALIDQVALEVFL